MYNVSLRNMIIYLPIENRAVIFNFDLVDPHIDIFLTIVFYHIIMQVFMSFLSCLGYFHCR